MRLALLLVALMLIISAAGAKKTSPVRSPRYFCLIVIDACRPDYLNLAPTPNLDALKRSGASFDNAWVGHLESITPASHATMTTGCFPAHTGVLAFGWRDPKTMKMYSPTARAAMDRGELEQVIARSGVPSIVRLYKERYPGEKIVSISSAKPYAADSMAGPWADYVIFSERRPRLGSIRVSYVGKHKPPDSILTDPKLNYARGSGRFNEDTWAADAAIECIKQFKPGMMLINLPKTDEEGHRTGGIVAPNVMREVVANADAQVGRIVNAYKDAGTYDKTLLVVTADHGMLPNLHTVDGNAARKKLEAAGIGVQGITGGSGGFIYLKDPKESEKAAAVLDKAWPKGVDAIFFRAGSPGRFIYLPTQKTKESLPEGAVAAYGYLASTYANASSPDALLFYRENTLTLRPGKDGIELPTYPPVVLHRGAHGGASWLVQHIPLIIVGPGVKAGYVSHDAARLCDIAPTASELLSLSAEGMDGVCLADTLTFASDDVKKEEWRTMSKIDEWAKALRELSEKEVAEDRIRAASARRPAT
jgi:hypothetical protein